MTEQRVYGSDRRAAIALCVPAMGAVVLIVRIATAGWVAVWVTLLVALGFGVVFIAGFGYLLGVKTVATSDGLVIGVRRDFLPWREIQGVELVSNELVNLRYQPSLLVQVGLSSGVPLTLPFLNERTVEDLPAEVDQLRRMWIAGRGSDWRPAGPLSPVGDDALKGELSLRWRLLGLGATALTAAMIAVAVGLPLGIVLLVTDVYAKIWLVMLAVFVLALPVVWWRER